MNQSQVDVQPSPPEQPVRVGGIIAKYLPLPRTALYNLVLLFPLIATYEFGRLVLQSPIAPGRELVARSIVNGAFQWFGFNASWLAAVAFLAILVMQHAKARQVPTLRWPFVLLMLAEILVLAVPLLVLSRTMLLASGVSAAVCLQALGGAIYEEMLFRFFLLGGLLWLVRNKLRIRMFAVDTALVIVVAALFSAIHLQPIGAEPFAIGPFTYRLLAGAYLGAIFVARGIGVAIGAHAIHNLAVVFWFSPAAGA